MQTHAPSTRQAAPEEPTHPCVRCGAPVPAGIAMCDRCNPLGLAQPASTQAHGTILVAIVVSVVALALLGRFALSGIGPFTATVAGVEPIHDGLAVTLSVTNEGTSAGSTTCRVYVASDPGVTTSAYLQSPQIGPNQTVSFSQETTVLGASVVPLGVECSGP
jgi:hypothetical protein